MEENSGPKPVKRRAVDNAPLEKHLKVWDTLTVQEKHDTAVMTIDMVYVIDENGVESFSVYEKQRKIAVSGVY